MYRARLQTITAMTKPVLKITVCSAVLLLAAGCSGYNKLLKSNDREQMYKAALDYFEKGKFDKTLRSSRR